MPKVLVVDDSALMRKVLEKILKEKTILEIVSGAKTGEEAVQQYRKYQPDLVTMDVIMPVMSGIDALGKILSEFPKAKIVMVSAINKKHMIINAIKLGAVNFILKPISEKKIVDTVRDVLGKEVIRKSSSKMIKVKSRAASAAKMENVKKPKVVTRVYENFQDWFNDIEDEEDSELLHVWADKVANGKMTTEKFNKKIKLL